MTVNTSRHVLSVEGVNYLVPVDYISFMNLITSLQRQANRWVWLWKVHGTNAVTTRSQPIKDLVSMTVRQGTYFLSNQMPEKRHGHGAVMVTVTTRKQRCQTNHIAREKRKPITILEDTTVAERHAHGNERFTVHTKPDLLRGINQLNSISLISWMNLITNLHKK